MRAGFVAQLNDYDTPSGRKCSWASSKCNQSYWNSGARGFRPGVLPHDVDPVSLVRDDRPPSTPRGYVRLLGRGIVLLLQLGASTARSIAHEAFRTILIKAC